MLTALRMAGIALVALFAGASVPLDSPGARTEYVGEYGWRMLDHDTYEGIVRQRAGAEGDVTGTLVLAHSHTGYDARMTSSMLVPPYPFLVSVVDDRIIVYADTELGDLRFDLPIVGDLPATWTLRTGEWGELHGRLEISRR